MINSRPVPLVSVIVPCFNEAAVVQRAVVSVLRQGLSEVDVVVVDDGSTDDTAAIALALDSVSVRVVSKANRGLPAARNTGISEARGNLIQFLDADDELLPGALDGLVNAFDNSPGLGMAAGGHVTVSEQGHPLEVNRAWRRPRLDHRSWLATCPVVPSAVMVDRDWLLRVGGFDEEQRYVEDWDLWLRLGRAGCPMAWVERPVARHYLSDASMSQRGRQMRDGTLRALDKALSLCDVGDPGPGRARARAHLIGACRLVAAGEGEAGREDLVTAFDLDPELAVGAWPPAANWVSGWAANPSVEDPIRFLDEIVKQPGHGADVLANLRDVMVQRALCLRAWKALDVGEPADAADWLRVLTEQCPDLSARPERVVDSLIHYARRARDGDAETFVRVAFDAIELHGVGWPRQRRRAVGLLRMLEAQDRRRKGEDGFESAIDALGADPRLAANRGLAAVVVFSLRRRRGLASRFIRASARVPNRPNLSLAASAIWTARLGELVFVARGSRMRIAPGTVRLSPGSILTVGLRDLSPTDHTTVEVERGGRLVLDGSVEFMHGAWLRVKPDARMTIGRNTYVMSQAILWCRSRVDIGSRCAIAWRAQIMDSDEHRLHSVLEHERGASASDKSLVPRPIHRGSGPPTASVSIGDHVWVGSGASILKGVTVCDGAVVASSSVVTRRVPPGALVAGSPARVIREAVRWR